MASDSSVIHFLPYDSSSFSLVSKGAEARIFEGTFLGKSVILKIRVPKKYRITSLDERLRKQRTSTEARIMHAVKQHGVHVPFIFDVDVKKSSILMQKIIGTKLRDLIYSGCLRSEELSTLFFEVGATIHRLHQAKVVHGDLTTSNIIISNNIVYLIDFGLSKFSETLEDRAVDLLVMKRTLESTHQNIFSLAWTQFITGYQSLTEIPTQSILRRLQVIEQRARHMV